VTSAELHAALLKVAEYFALTGAVLYGRPGSRIGQTESVAHELAHYLFTGPTFENILNDSPPDVTNQHEASALRVEVAALRELGCEVSLKQNQRSRNLLTD